MSLAGNLQRMNRETSSRLSVIAANNAHPVRNGRMGMLAAACGAFFRTYIVKKNFTRGKEGFILSCGAAVEALVQAVKVWELAFRRAERGPLPPVSEAEVDKLSSRYASWTAS